MPSLEHQNPCDEEAQVGLPPMRQRPKPGAPIEHPGEQRNKIHEIITMNDNNHDNAMPKRTLKYPIVYTDTDDDYNLCYHLKKKNNLSQTLHIDCNLPMAKNNTSQTIHIDCSLPLHQIFTSLTNSSLQHLNEITLTNLPFQNQHLCPHAWGPDIPIARPLLPHRDIIVTLLLEEEVVEWEDCPFEEWEEIPVAVQVDAKLRVWMRDLEGEGVTKEKLEEVVEIVAGSDDGLFVALAAFCGAFIAAAVVVCVLGLFFPTISR